MIFSIVLLVCALSTNVMVTGDQITEEWTRFLIKYQKHYKSVAQWYIREAIFRQNLENYRNHNKLYDEGKVSYTKGVNKFSDMTKDELIDYVRGGLLENYPKVIEEGQAWENSSDYSEFVDWREREAVTSVKDMGPCNAAYAFSAAGAIEGQVEIVKGFLVDVSPQNLIDCSKEDGNKACNGGLMSYCFDYVTKHGITSEEIYPYSSHERGQCSFEENKSIARLQAHVNIPSGSEKALQNAIATRGPISVGLHVPHDFMSYSFGIFNDDDCNADQPLNHAALAVGYGTENGMDYYIVKNCFGEDWGENGYFRIIRNKNNTCGIASLASYPVLG